MGCGQFDAGVNGLIKGIDCQSTTDGWIQVTFPAMTPIVTLIILIIFNIMVNSSFEYFSLVLNTIPRKTV